jgi:glycogen operon protein
MMWHGTKAYHPDWQDYSRSLAFSLSYPEHNEYLYVILNAYWKDLTFELPKLQESRKWFPVIDTHKSYPKDFSNLKRSGGLKNNLYKAAPRSVVVFWGK